MGVVREGSPGMGCPVARMGQGSPGRDGGQSGETSFFNTWGTKHQALPASPDFINLTRRRVAPLRVLWRDQRKGRMAWHNVLRAIRGSTELHIEGRLTCGLRSVCVSALACTCVSMCVYVHVLPTLLLLLLLQLQPTPKSHIS